jgi:hypothetical protein
MIGENFDAYFIHFVCSMLSFTLFKRCSQAACVQVLTGVYRFKYYLGKRHIHRCMVLVLFCQVRSTHKLYEEHAQMPFVQAYSSKVPLLQAEKEGGLVAKLLEFGD